MDTSDRTQILDRVNKLLALADPERGGTEAEREQALERAQRMMFEHRVSLADAEAHGTVRRSENDVIVVEVDVFWHDKHMRELQSCLVLAFGGSSVKTPKSVGAMREAYERAGKLDNSPSAEMIKILANITDRQERTMDDPPDIGLTFIVTKEVWGMVEVMTTRLWSWLESEHRVAFANQFPDDSEDEGQEFTVTITPMETAAFSYQEARYRVAFRHEHGVDVEIMSKAAIVSDPRIPEPLKREFRPRTYGSVYEIMNDRSPWDMDGLDPALNLTPKQQRKEFTESFYESATQIIAMRVARREQEMASGVSGGAQLVTMDKAKIQRKRDELYGDQPLRQEERKMPSVNDGARSGVAAGMRARIDGGDLKSGGGLLGA